MSESLEPKDHVEAVALFRAQVIGPLVARSLVRGDLATAILEIATRPLCAPGCEAPRRYAPATIERWYYAFKLGGLDALKPRDRSDRGHAQALTPEQQQLVLGIAEQRPEVNASVLLRTLVRDGRIEEGQITESTLRRFLQQHSLDRLTQRKKAKGHVRRRWAAERPGELWHADVCHGPSLSIAEKTVPLRVHALLDDASRFIVQMRAFSSEREVDMLELLIAALRLHGRPKTLYLDNGSTYRGDALKTVCGRLGITLIHAEPHDPEARGKMERFWRTLREKCLDHLGTQASLHDVQVRLIAFLNQDYLPISHAGLVGKCPAEAYAERINEEVTEDELDRALTFRVLRRVRKDGTVSVGGIDWELEAGGFLAGRKVTVARTLFEPERPPWVEHEDQRFDLQLVDPIANGLRPRRESHKKRRDVDLIPFDPTTATLNAALRRPKNRGDS